MSIGEDIANAFKRSEIGPRAAEISAACVWLAGKREARYAFAGRPGVLMLAGDLNELAGLGALKQTKAALMRVFWCTPGDEGATPARINAGKARGPQALCIADDWHKFKVQLKKDTKKHGLDIDADNLARIGGAIVTAVYSAVAIVLTCYPPTTAVGVAMGAAIPLVAAGTAAWADGAAEKENAMLGTDAAGGDAARFVGGVGSAGAGAAKGAAADGRINAMDLKSFYNAGAEWAKGEGADEALTDAVVGTLNGEGVSDEDLEGSAEVLTDALVGALNGDGSAEVDDQATKDALNAPPSRGNKRRGGRGTVPSSTDVLASLNAPSVVPGKPASPTAADDSKKTKTMFYVAGGTVAALVFGGIAYAATR